MLVRILEYEGLPALGSRREEEITSCEGNFICPTHHPDPEAYLSDELAKRGFQLVAVRASDEMPISSLLPYAKEIEGSLAQVGFYLSVHGQEKKSGS